MQAYICICTAIIPIMFYYSFNSSIALIVMLSSCIVISIRGMMQSNLNTMRRCNFMHIILTRLLQNNDPPRFGSQFIICLDNRGDSSAVSIVSCDLDYLKRSEPES